MAFGNKARIAALEARNAQLEQLFGRADVRLDTYGPELAGIFGDTPTAHSAGRWTSSTTVRDIYGINVSNVPVRRSWRTVSCIAAGPSSSRRAPRPSPSASGSTGNAF